MTTLRFAGSVVALFFSLGLVFPPFPSAASATDVMCGGLVATIVGTDISETIDGTSGVDVIHGRDGADVINGKGGDDVICGGAGSDTLLGKSGDDTLIGGKGADILKGGAGNDILKAGAGADVLYGDQGDDTLSGGAGRDVLWGNAGADTLHGKRGKDSISGGADVDTANGGTGKDQCASESEALCEHALIDFSLDRVYVTQSVPAADSDDSPNVRAPTIEGRAGLIRIFITTTREDAGYTPEVVLHWRDGSNVKDSAVLIGPDPIPTTAFESNLGDTFNYTFDASFLDEGMDVYIEIDPDNHVMEAAEGNNRFPSSGWYKLGVKVVPSLDMTFVPMTVNGVPAVVDQEIAETLLVDAVAILPIADYTIEIHTPIAYNGDDWGEMLDVITQAKLDDGSPRTYIGIVAEGAVGCCTGGMGWIAWPASVSLERSSIVAHELGHNLSLRHAPCGNPDGQDPGYPYSGAGIGSWGYNIDESLLVSPAKHLDLMSYCSPVWISDYHYDIAAEFRTSVVGFASNTLVGEDEVVMSFMGVIESVDFVDKRLRPRSDETGSPFAVKSPVRVSRISRVAMVDAAPLPPTSGDYVLVGVNDAGSTVMSFPFSGFFVESEGPDTAKYFAFSIPIKAAEVATIVKWQVRNNSGDTIASLDA